jgi:hypothetical protein
MKSVTLVLLFSLCFLLACGSTPKPVVATSNVRNYNGTASVGDFLTISVDSVTQSIAYQNYTNGEAGTVPYTVNPDGSYTITDPQGNLLSAYEVPGYVMVVEAGNAGPNKDTSALVTAIESVPATIDTFVGQNFNMTQFRTNNGGVEIGTVAIDASANITARSYDPGAIMWTQGTYFNGGTMLASGTHEDPSGTFFTVTAQNDNSQSTVFGTQNGLWAVDNSNGAILGLPKAARKDFDTASAGSYTAIYYEKQNAQMQGQGNSSVEVGTPVQGKASISVSSGGLVTITDSQSNAMMATGTLVPVADASYIYDGTANTLPDPCYGMFTFRIDTNSLHQDVFLTFQGNAVIFSSFQTAKPLVNNGTYTYFYGVGLK